MSELICASYLCKLTATIIAMERFAVDVAKYMMMMMMMIKCFGVVQSTPSLARASCHDRH